MKPKRLRLLSLMLPAVALFAAASDDADSVRTVNWQAGFTGAGSTGDWAPYLIGSNSGGRHAMKGTADVSASISTDFRLDRRFSWTAGAEVAAGYQSSADYERMTDGVWTSRPWHPARAIVYQLWAGVKFRGVALTAGMRDHVSPMVDDRLSSGDLVLSNNARAIPQVEIGFVDFQDIPFTRGWAQIDAALSYGKYTDSDALKGRYNYYNDHITLGQLFTYKRLHFRSRPDRPLSVTVGFQLGGEFGGTTYRYDKGKEYAVIKNSQKPRAFWEMLIPTARYSDGFVEGNHVGSWDLKARYRFHSGVSAEGYFQWLWEDGSGMAKRNMTDGLWGATVSLPGDRPALSKILVEYIDFRDQSGPMHWAPSDNPGTTITTEATGGDNYYNNSSFNAWVNYGLGLGSAFPKAPLYNADGYAQYKHNRTRGVHIGATGYVCPTLAWTAKFSYGVAWGTGRIPYATALHNTSAIVEARWDAARIVKGLSVDAAVAFDAGSLRGDNFGALVKVAYSGSFGFGK